MPAAAVKGHSGGITDLAYSPDGKRIVSSCDDGKIKIWEFAKGKDLFTLSGYKGVVTCVAFRPDGKRIVSGGYNDRIVKLWDAETGKLLQPLSPDWPDGRSIRLQPESLDFSPDGKRLLCAGGAKVAVWAMDSGKLVAVLEGHKSRVVSARFSPDGKNLGESPSDFVSRGAREKSVLRQQMQARPRPRCRSHSNSQSIPKVGLEPTRVLPHRILSPVRLPLPWYWKHVGATLKASGFKAVTMLPSPTYIIAALG